MDAISRSALRPSGFASLARRRRSGSVSRTRAAGLLQEEAVLFRQVRDRPFQVTIQVPIQAAAN
jgi:hypothetical protein